jgi:hypothetical protein
MFVPHREGLYGSYHYSFRISKSTFREYTKQFSIKTTHQKYIDKERVIYQQLYLTIG